MVIINRKEISGTKGPTVWQEKLQIPVLQNSISLHEGVCPVLAYF